MSAHAVLELAGYWRNHGLVMKRTGDMYQTGCGLMSLEKPKDHFPNH